MVGSLALEPTAWILIPALPFTIYGTVCELLNLCVPQLSHLSNGDKNGNYFTELLEYMQPSEQCLAH